MWKTLVVPSWYSGPLVQWPLGLAFISCLVWATPGPAKPGCRLDVV